MSELDGFLPTPAEKKQQELAVAVRHLKENLPAHIEAIAVQAVLTRRKFVALKAQGFTDEQALFLCSK